jgi:hypothetical protein
MFRASALLLLASCALIAGCDTGSTAQNDSTTGWKGQKVGKSSNVENGPVAGSTTGTEGNIQNPQPKPAQDEPKATQNLDSD